MDKRGQQQRRRMLAVYGAIALAAFGLGIGLAVLAFWALIHFF